MSDKSKGYYEALRALVTLRGHARDQASSLQDRIDTLTSEETLLAQVQGVLQAQLDAEVLRGAKAVDHLLTEGLRAVFTDQDLRVRSDVDLARGRVSVNLTVIQKTSLGEIEGLSADAFGGAVTTVISVLLRIILMLRRGLRPILLLDETLPAFDVNYVHNMGAFLSTYCQKAGLDILLVTHNPALVDAADVAYRLYADSSGVRVHVLKPPKESDL